MLNLQEMAQTAQKVIQQLQDLATQTVGVDVMWFRVIPKENSEDLIFQEYTLSGVDCPKIVKVVLTQSDFNPGGYITTMFGLEYESNMEINVPISEWQEIYGKDTMPQRDDFVYIQIYNKMFQVKSSNIIYGIGSAPMYFRISLGKYIPTRSVEMPQNIADSIDEMTVSQEKLFGKEISEEVIDITMPMQTDYNVETYVDPMKDFDMDSITHEKLTALNGNIVGYAYYNMSIAEKPVIYNISAQYLPDDERNHWIFSCWFKFYDPNSSNEEKPVRSFSLHTKDKQYAYFRISTPLKLYEGDLVTVMRGKLISVSGEIVTLKCENGFFVKVPVSSFNKAEKQLTGWYKSGTYRISKRAVYNLIRTDNDTISVNVNKMENSISVKFGNSSKTFTSKKMIDFDKWGYLCIDFSNAETHLIYQQIALDGQRHMYMDEIFNDNIKNVKKSGDFEFDNIILDSAQTPVQIRNIRIYMNEYPVEETYKLDMMKATVPLESKMIICDGPRVPDTGEFVSPVR